MDIDTGFVAAEMLTWLMVTVAPRRLSSKDSRTSGDSLARRVAQILIPTLLPAVVPETTDKKFRSLRVLMGMGI